MRQIFSSADSATIGLVQSRLEAAGISSEIRNEAVSQVMVGFPFVSELWILRDEDYEDACRLLSPELPNSK
jgi:hypothetical protein